MCEFIKLNTIRAILSHESEWPIFYCGNTDCDMSFTIGLVCSFGEEGMRSVIIPGPQGQGKLFCPYCGVQTKYKLPDFCYASGRND